MTQPVDALVQQWAVTANIRAAGPRLLSVHVAYAVVPVALVETGPSELELRTHWTAPQELAADQDALHALAIRTTFARAGQLRCTVVGGAIDIAYPVHLDGLTRTTFYDAASEVAKAAVSIDESARNDRADQAPAPSGEAGEQPPVEPVALDEPAAMNQQVAIDEPVALDEPEGLDDVAGAPVEESAARPFADAEAAPDPAQFAEVPELGMPTPTAATMAEPMTERMPVVGFEPAAEPAADSAPVIPTPVMYSPPIADETRAPRSAVDYQPPGRGEPQQAQQPEQFPSSQQVPETVEATEPHRISQLMGQHPVGQQPIQAAPRQQPVQQSQWLPTHTVPPGGVPAWAAPDPAQPPVTQLPPGLAVRLAERQGGWARIETENGWSAWVDGRPLPDPPSV